VKVGAGDAAGAAYFAEECSGVDEVAGLGRRWRWTRNGVKV